MDVQATHTVVTGIPATWLVICGVLGIIIVAYSALKSTRWLPVVLLVIRRRLSAYHVWLSASADANR